MTKIKIILKNIDQEDPVAPTLGPQDPCGDHIFAIKEYGWSVISRLNEWLTQVLGVLKETKRLCKGRQKRISKGIKKLKSKTGLS